MHADFSEPSRAASYLAEGLRAQFPEAEFEVVACDPVTQRFRSMVCGSRELPLILEGMCRGFPGASVDYEPKHPYGMVGAIFSAEHRFNNPSASSHSAQRHKPPVVTKQDGRYVRVILRRVKEEEILLGSRTIVPQNTAAIEPEGGEQSGNLWRDRSPF